MATFETGLSTFAANDVALTVVNSGGTYQRYKEASSPYYARIVVADAVRTFGRCEYGRHFSEHEINECIEYVVNDWASE